jgi:putative transposase
MPNTYTQIHLHFVFAVQNRLSLIHPEMKERLYQYITGIVQRNNHKMIIINGMPDRLHIVVGMRPTQSVADLLQDIKGGSSKWINDSKVVKGKFQWQEGYGAFSYNKSALPKLIEYVKHQEEHHRKKTFLEEYKEFCKRLKLNTTNVIFFMKLNDAGVLSYLRDLINHVNPFSTKLLCLRYF